MVDCEKCSYGERLISIMKPFSKIWFCHFNAIVFLENDCETCPNLLSIELNGVK
jgi:hypothetical protein